MNMWVYTFATRWNDLRTMQAHFEHRFSMADSLLPNWSLSSARLQKTSMQTACFDKENQTRACSEFHRSRSTARSDQHRCRAFKEHSFMHSQGQHNWARITTQNQRSDRQTESIELQVLPEGRKGPCSQLWHLNPCLVEWSRLGLCPPHGFCAELELPQVSRIFTWKWRLQHRRWNNERSLTQHLQTAKLSSLVPIHPNDSVLLDTCLASDNSAQVSFNIFQSFTWRKRSVPSLVYKPIGNKETKSKDEAVVATTKLGMIAWLKPYRIVAQQIRLNPRNKASLKSMTFVSKDTRDTEEAKD